MRKLVLFTVGLWAFLALVLVLAALSGSPSDAGSGQPERVVAEEVLQELNGTEEKAWYEGGSLHDASALEWQSADYANKLATAGDLVSAAYNKGLFIPELASKIKSMDDLRLLSVELVTQMDVALEPNPDPDANKVMFANQSVVGTAGTIMMLSGWVRN